MVKTDYDKIIEQLANPDTVADAIAQLSEQLDKDVKAYDGLVQSNDVLRDTNAKLALRITAPINNVGSEPTHEPTYDEMLASAQQAYLGKE